MKYLRKIGLIMCMVGVLLCSVNAYASSNPAGDTANPSDVSNQTSQNSTNRTDLNSQQKENVQFAPKVIVQGCRFSKSDIQAGDEVKVTIVLKNTSLTEKLRNMTVTVTEQGEYLSLSSDTDTTYIDTVKAGAVFEITCVYKVRSAAPEGQYCLDVNMDYADSKGNVYTANGKARMNVEQPVRIQIDPIVMNQEVSVGDVLHLEGQVINLGRSKIYNVRAVIEAEGLKSSGTLFIGDLEPGTTGNGSTKVTITGLTGGSTPYGNTEGRVTFYYEDASGKAYEEQQKISTYIGAPFSEEEMMAKEPDKTGQWWIIMTVVATLLTLLIAGAAFVIARHKKMPF